MSEQNFRTYKRRPTTRSSGYHTCEENTGGECIIYTADKYKMKTNIENFIFYRPKIKITSLFETTDAIVAFGGYIKSSEKVRISFYFKYEYEGMEYKINCDNSNYPIVKFKGGDIEPYCWNNIGAHFNHTINMQNELNNVNLFMKIECDKLAELEFISFDFDCITKKEFLDDTLKKSFNQKTEMHIPHIYYLSTNLTIDEYLISSQREYIKNNGEIMVLKSCNRCGRYLPININNELNTLGFSIHCKKNAPCKHPLFSSYKISNVDSEYIHLGNIKLSDNKVCSYHGHQLECRACKKFFVNAALNPQRNPDQFKEDGLRRRAIERLVNLLLEKNIVPLEFRDKTGRDFAEYIWKKFNKRCFKCGVNSPEITLKEMHLDHTRPLAYLYRLDEFATCLCSTHNSSKRDHFPVDFYSEDELIRLSNITGLSMEALKSKSINEEVLSLLIENVVWYFDEFLMDEEYQKIRDGIRTADKINDALKRVINGRVYLEAEYKRIKGYYPNSITIKGYKS